MKAFRLTKKKHLDTALTGKGAYDFGARWNTKHHSMVYAAENFALTVLEHLAHRDELEEFQSILVIPLAVPDELVLTLADLGVKLPARWWTEELMDLTDKKGGKPASTQKIGDDWLTSRRSCALAVPNTIVRRERNILINPAHPDFRRIIPGKPFPFVLDKRLR